MLGVDVESGVLKIGTPIVVFREKEVNFILFRKAISMSNWEPFNLSSITIKMEEPLSVLSL